MSGIMSQQEMVAYINALKKRAKAEILKPAKSGESKS